MMNIRKIQEIEEARRKVRKEIYKKIFDQFGRKIQVSVDAYQKQVFLEVPTFLIGYPSFDVTKASAYLKRQLINSGFRVESMSQTVFNVSWYTEKEKKEKELPVYDPAPPSFADESLPSLINLKKAAKRYA